MLVARVVHLMKSDDTGICIFLIRIFWGIIFIALMKFSDTQLRIFNAAKVHFTNGGELLSNNKNILYF
jgi:hypothetical protein